jgi:hypothetical protein
MAQKKPTPSNIPKGDKEFARHTTYLMITPDFDATKQWSLHTQTLAEVKAQIQSRDTVDGMYENIYEEKSPYHIPCRPVRVTIIYEEL